MPPENQLFKEIIISNQKSLPKDKPYKQGHGQIEAQGLFLSLQYPSFSCTIVVLTLATLPLRTWLSPTERQ